MPFRVSKRCAANVGAEFHGVPAVGPAQIVGPLKPVFDVQIRIAAAPAGELGRAGELAGVNEDDAGEAQKRRRKQRQVVLLRRRRRRSGRCRRTAVVADKAEAEFIDQVGVKIWISESTACALLSMEAVPPPIKPGKLPTAGLRIRTDGESAVQDCSSAESVWSTRISPWSVFENWRADRKSCARARRALRSWAAAPVRRSRRRSGFKRLLRNDVAGERGRRSPGPWGRCAASRDRRSPS